MLCWTSQLIIKRVHKIIKRAGKPTQFKMKHFCEIRREKDRPLFSFFLRPCLFPISFLALWMVKEMPAHHRAITGTSHKINQRVFFLSTQGALPTTSSDWIEKQSETSCRNVSFVNFFCCFSCPLFSYSSKHINSPPFHSFFLHQKIKKRVLDQQPRRLCECFPCFL